MMVISLKGGCGGEPKRVVSAAEGAEEEVKAARGAELASAALEWLAAPTYSRLLLHPDASWLPLLRLAVTPPERGKSRV